MTYTGEDAGHVQHTIALQWQRTISVVGWCGIVAGGMSATNGIGRAHTAVKGRHGQSSCASHTLDV